MNSKRILVTGAAGFLGSHLCDSLLNEDNRVIGVDNLSTGNEANLAHLCNESRFEFVQQDICRPFDVGAVDFIFNFASPASRVDEHLPVNIGNPDEWTILDCAEEILKVTGLDREIIYKPLPQDDPTRRRPDISKAKTLLGWEPKIKLRQGLELSLAYFQVCVDKQLVMKA